MKGGSFCLKLNGDFSFSGFSPPDRTMKPIASLNKSNYTRLNFSKCFFQPLIDTKNCAWCFHVYYSLNLAKMKFLFWYPDFASQMNYSSIHSLFIVPGTVLSTIANTKIIMSLCSSGTQSSEENISTIRCDTLR